MQSSSVWNKFDLENMSFGMAGKMSSAWKTTLFNEMFCSQFDRVNFRQAHHFPLCTSKGRKSLPKLSYFSKIQLRVFLRRNFKRCRQDAKSTFLVTREKFPTFAKAHFGYWLATVEVAMSKINMQVSVKKLTKESLLGGRLLTSSVCLLTRC